MFFYCFFLLVLNVFSGCNQTLLREKTKAFVISIHSTTILQTKIYHNLAHQVPLCLSSSYEKEIKQGYR